VARQIPRDWRRDEIAWLCDAFPKQRARLRAFVSELWEIESKTTPNEFTFAFGELRRKIEGRGETIHSAVAYLEATARRSALGDKSCESRGPQTVISQLPVSLQLAFRGRAQ